jgi:hypothetical protein
MIVLLTESGKNSQWVNQEIGYAYALKKRVRILNANLPHIIPISRKNVELKGFITKDSVDILFLDKYVSVPELIITDIITQIRLRIPRGLEDRVLHFRVTCSNCFSENGLPTEYLDYLPSHQIIIKAIQSGIKVLESTCPKCKTKNNIDIRTFFPYKSEK